MGEPFLGNLKAHLQELIRQHQSVASSADSGPPQKRLKRAVQPRRLRKRERESWRQPLRSTRRKRALNGYRQPVAAAPLTFRQ